MTIVDTDASLETRSRPPLGVGALFGRAWRLLASAFLPLVGVCLVYFVLVRAVTLLVVQWLAGRGIPLVPVGEAVTTGMSAIQVVLGALGILAAALVFAAFYGAMFFVALRREAGERAEVRAAIGVGLRFMLPMFLSFIVVGLLVALGFAALVVPGLWLIGVYGLVPAVMIGDGRARGVLGRTRRLTKDYRWPLVGFFVLLYVAVFAFGLLAGIFAVAVPIDPTDISASVLRSLLIDAPVSAVTTAIVFAGCTVAYRRLLEIKEGAGSRELRAVFE